MDSNVSIIAMKGNPFTRKTEFANVIAVFLRCPILSMEHFLHLLTPPISPEQEYEAFKVICKITFQHLHKRMSDNVVIDSPLSSQTHLALLTDLASKLKPAKVRVIVVECKTTNPYSWSLQVQKYFDLHSPTPVAWFKPKNWEDVEKVIKDNPDYDEALVEGNEFVSKLVVDPLLDSGLYHGYASYAKPLKTPLVEAVRYMMTRFISNGPNVIVYSEWLHQWSQCQSSYSTEYLPASQWCSMYGHNIVRNSMAMEELQHKAADCRACQKQVTRSDDGYCYCKNCNLVMHMKCALSFHNSVDEMKKNPYYYGTDRDKCQDCGKYFARWCYNCLFNAHLKCMPTAIEHFDTKEHFLTIVLTPDMPDIEPDMKLNYLCVACGEDSLHNLYICQDCGAAYHYECVTLPRRLKDEHGGHHHNLSLKFNSEEAEDYICQECQELRDPKLWFYSCEDCDGYELHPWCIDAFKEFYPTKTGDWLAYKFSKRFNLKHKFT